MARIRTVKPELARHRDLFELEKTLKAPIRFAWVMMFTVCDREGRFKWRPWELKLDVLPYDEIDFSRVLDAWLTLGMVVKYRVGREWYGCIPTFRKHQVINHREKDSDIPGIDESEEVIEEQTTQSQTFTDASLTRELHNNDALSDSYGTTSGEGKGREGKGTGREGKGYSLERQRVDDATLIPESPTVILIPLNDKTDFPITQAMVDQFLELYPGIDVMQELRNCKGWSLNNPRRRKTKSGIMRYVNGWLSKAQNNARITPADREDDAIQKFVNGGAHG